MSEHGDKQSSAQVDGQVDSQVNKQAYKQNLSASNLTGWRNQFHVFFNAVVFFTRLPAPSYIQFNESFLQDAARYFPLVGAIVAALVWCSLSLALFILPIPIAVILAMIVSVLITGAFHEDGLADCADAFGGGYGKEQILTIMHDSRLGTYGVIALCASLGLKFCLLFYLVSYSVTFYIQFNFQLLVILLLANSLSRWLAVVLMYCTPYVAFTGSSKSKPIASRVTRLSVVIASVTALGFLSLAANSFGWLVFAALPLLLAIVYILARRYFIRHIGGVNGDCLGAVQQVSELSILLTLCAFAHSGCI